MNAILGKKQDKEEIEKQREQLSAVLREDKNELSFKKALVISTIAHPLVAILSWLLIRLLIFILAFLGITLPLFMKPKPKLKNIEFVIINKPEKPPINKHTKLRSDRNSRAGGKHDPKRKEADPEPVTSTAKPQKPTPPPKKAATKIQQKTQTHKPAPKAPRVPPRPIPRRQISIPKVTAPNPFSVPVPITKRPPRQRMPIGGPVTSGPIGTSAPSAEPAPIMAAGNPGQNTLRRSPVYSIGGGNAGNPSLGNPNGSPGIDALKEPDFGPYMRELQRRIKRRWNPPRGNRSKRVVLMFKVSKDGRLLSLSVHTSSEKPESDEAAINAVKAAAPFRPLPPEYRGNDIDIQFTFDYNVFGIGGKQF